MSWVIAAPEYVTAAAQDLAGIASTLSSANSAAAFPTAAVVAAGGDEVSAVVASIFNSHAQAYQALSAQAAMFHEQFVQLMSGGATQYAAAEALNATPMAPAAAFNSDPVPAPAGGPLIGNVTSMVGGAGRAGGNGGWLVGSHGNAGAGLAGVAGGNSGLGGLGGNGGWSSGTAVNAGSGVDANGVTNLDAGLDGGVAGNHGLGGGGALLFPQSAVGATALQPSGSGNGTNSGNSGNVPSPTVETAIPGDGQLAGTGSADVPELFSPTAGAGIPGGDGGLLSGSGLRDGDGGLFYGHGVDGGAGVAGVLGQPSGAREPA